MSGKMRGPAPGVVLAVLATALLSPAGTVPAQAQAGACRDWQHELRGPAGRPCELSMPIRFRTFHGEPVERTLAVAQRPSRGTLRILRSPAANRLAVVYTPAGRGALRDRFALRMCTRDVRGMQCAVLPYRVILSAPRRGALAAPAAG